MIRTMLAVVIGLMPGLASQAAAQPLKPHVLAGEPGTQANADVSTMDSVADDPKAVLIRTEMREVNRTPHQRKLDDGTLVPWIDENLDPLTGDWDTRDVILDEEARRKKEDQPAGLVERGKDYNHSTFCDLVITGLVGLHPRSDDIIEVNPLVPEDKWDYHCLDDVLYHGRSLTVIWDKGGTKYGRSTGLNLLVDGKLIAHSVKLAKLTGHLEQDGSAPNN